MATDIGRIVGTIQLKDLFSTPGKLAIATIGGIGVAAIKASKDFESSFAGVRKTVNTTEEGFAKLAAGIRQMSKEIPTGVNALNKIAESAGQLGIQEQNIVSFTRTVADLGETTDLAGDEAASALARIANITQLPQTQFDRLGSTIVALGNNFATVESKIVDFTLRIAGAGEIAGLSEPQIAAIGAAMASVGVEAEAGGTSVQKVLLGISKSVAQNTKDLSIYAQTAGVSASEFKRAWEQDAGQAFTRFIEGLGRQGINGIATLEALNLTDQRLIRSFLSLAGAGDLLSRAMATGNRAFSENTALAKEAEQRYNTFASQIAITGNKLNDILISLGDQMVPMLRDLNKELSAWIDSGGLDRLSASIVRGFKSIVEIAKVLVDNIHLIKGAFAALIAINFLKWASTVVAGFRAIQLSMGPVGIALVALTALYVTVTSKLKALVDQQQQDIDRMVAGARRAGDELTKMRRAADAFRVDPKKLEEQIAAAEKAIRLAQDSGNEQALRAASSEWTKATEALAKYRAQLLTPDELTATEKSWADSTEALKNYHAELDELTRQQQDRSSISDANAPPPSLGDLLAQSEVNKARNERVEALRQLIQQEETNQKVTATTIARARELRIELVELTGETEDFTGGLNLQTDAEEDARKAFEKLVKSMKEQVIQSRHLAKAALEGEEALAKAEVTTQIWNELLAAEIPILDSVTGELTSQAQILIKLIKLRLSAQNAAKEAINNAQAEKDALDRLNESLGERYDRIEELNKATDISLRESAKILAVYQSHSGSQQELEDALFDANLEIEIQRRLLAEGATAGTEFGDAIALAATQEAMLAREIEKARKAAEKRTTNFEGIEANLKEGIQRAIADGFSEGFANLDAESLIGSFAKIGSDIIAEQISAAIMSAIEGTEGAWANLGKFFQSGAGKWAAALGTVSNIQNANNQGYAVAGAVIGGIIGSFIPVIGTWMGAFIGSAIGGAIKKGRPIIKAKIEEAASGLTIDVIGAVGKVGEEIEQGFDQILSHIGGEFRGLASGIAIETREGMSVIVDGIKHYFDKEHIGEGIQFAIIESLKRADIGNISAEARAVLNNTMADTMQELVSDLDFAKFFEHLNLDEAAIAVDNFVDQFLQTWNRMVKLGIDGAERMELWAVNSLKVAKNNILGIAETEQERIKRQSAAHNAQIRLLYAEQTMRRAELLARRTELEAKLKIAQANNELTKGQLDLEGEFLKSRGKLLSAEFELLQSIVDAIAAIDALLPGLLEGLISDADIDAAIRRAGGGGVNQKKQDRETVEDALDDFDLSLLSEAAQAIANINSKWDDMIPLAHGNADLLKRIAEARERELKALQKQLVIDPVSKWLFPGEGGTFGMSDWQQQEADIKKQFDAVREANQLLLDETGERAIEFWRLNLAEIRALQALAEDVIDSLGLPLESTRDRLESLGDATSYLQSQLDGGIISAERFGQVMSELAQQTELELLGIAAGLLDTMGLTEEAAEVRAAMAELEFHINRLQFNTLYEGFLALGIVSEEAAERFERLFGIINDPENWPTFDPADFMPTGGVGGTGNDISNAIDDIARDRERALEAIQNILRSAMNPYQRDLLELNEQFAEYRRLLGNTPDVLRAYNIALGQLNDRYTKNLRDTLAALKGITDTPFQNIESLKKKFDEIIASGDLGRSDELAQIINQLTDAYGSAYGTAGGGMAALLADIQARAAQFLGEGPSNLAKVLQFPVSAVDKVVNSPSPVSRGIDVSNTLLDKIEQNTRRTNDEIKKGTRETVVSRQVAHVDIRTLKDTMSRQGVKLGQNHVSLRSLRKAS